MKNEALDESLLAPLAEMYLEWCRLKGYKPAKTPFEAMIDKAVGAEDAHIREFLDWFSGELLPRLYGRALAKEMSS